MTDQNGTRVVTLRDRTFVAKPTMSAKDFGAITALASNTADGDFFVVLSTAVRNTLKRDQREAWDALWDEDLDEPITFTELAEAANKLCQDEAARPTLPLSPFGSSGESGGMRSTANSGSPVEAVPENSQSVPI